MQKGLRLFPLLLVPLAVSNMMLGAFDPDTWWHLRVGEVVAETGRIPRADPFSQQSQAEPVRWFAYSWLYEWLLYQAYALGGTSGIVWFRAGLVMLSFGTVVSWALKNLPPDLRGTIAAGALICSLMPLLQDRPWHITIAFTFITLLICERWRVKPTWWQASLLIILYILWANIHIQFVLGWLLLGLMFLFPGNASRLQTLGLLVACILATLINPFGYELWLVIWEYATQQAALRLILELCPPRLDSLTTWMAIVIGLLGAERLFSQGRHGQIDWFSMAALGAAAFFSARMQRDLWLVAVVGVWVCRTPNGQTGPRWLPLALGATILAITAIDLGYRHPGPVRAEKTAKQYPVAAVEYVKRERLPGPMFNTFDWGGYLIWELRDYPVMIDGRTNLYGTAALEQHEQTWNGREGWTEDPLLQRARFAIVPTYGKLAEVLSESPEWRIGHQDDTAIVFIRK